MTNSTGSVSAARVTNPPSSAWDGNTLTSVSSGAATVIASIDGAVNATALPMVSPPCSTVTVAPASAVPLTTVDVTDTERGRPGPVGYPSDGGSGTSRSRTSTETGVRVPSAPHEFSAAT